jgi:hypothetical protein
MSKSITNKTENYYHRLTSKLEKGALLSRSTPCDHYQRQQRKKKVIIRSTSKPLHTSTGIQPPKLHIIYHKPKLQKVQKMFSFRIGLRVHSAMLSGHCAHCSVLPSLLPAWAATWTSSDQSSAPLDSAPSRSARSTRTRRQCELWTQLNTESKHFKPLTWVTGRRGSSRVKEHGPRPVPLDRGPTRQEGNWKLV